MLLFSTVLEINHKMTRETFMELVVEWNRNMPYPENVIPGLAWNGEKSLKIGNDDLWLAAEEYGKASTVAVRYEKREKDGVIWDTDYVMNFRNMKMAIRLDRSYSEDAMMLNAAFSTPYIISSLIEKGLLKPDGDIPWKREQIYITEDNIQMLADAVLGKKEYRYPVIFVSKTENDEDPVDVRLLAYKLKGVAHVLVQSSKELNMAIKKACGKIEYLGAIGIYYPQKTIGHKRLMYRRVEGEDPFLMNKVVQEILQYCNEQTVDPLFTWQGVNNALLMDKFMTQSDARIAAENAKRQLEEKNNRIMETLDDETKRIKEEAVKEAREEADELIALVDEEIQSLKSQVAALTKANETLMMENEGLRNKVNSIGYLPLLTFGDEYEFYEGEIKDLILAVLDDSLKSLPDKSRRKDVVKDIIANNEYKHLSETKADEIKRMMKAYDGMPAKLKQDLESYGFEIKEDGKHYKILYYGDGRYTDILSKTPSDWRTGKTSALKLINIAF